MMKFLFPIFFLLVTPLFASVEGNYTFEGWDPYFNESYKGNAIITKDKNNVYQAIWNFDDGEKYKGTGLQNDSAVSFIFTRVSGPTGEIPIGLQIYKISDDKTLTGTWVLLEKTLLGSEKMVKQE